MFAYRDTLIGPGKLPITRGTSGRDTAETYYSWSVRVEDDALHIEITFHPPGDTPGRSIRVDDAPDYVMADIARVMASGSAASLAANERSTGPRWK